MAHPKLFLASFVVVLALSASSVAAAACPAPQVFTGVSPIGSDLVINYTLPVNSLNIYIAFDPGMCNMLTWYILSVNGNSIASNCGILMGGLSGAAGMYTATIKSFFFGQENTVPMKYTFTVYQQNC